MIVSITLIVLAIILVPVSIWLWVGYREKLSQERQKNRWKRREEQRGQRIIVC